MKNRLLWGLTAVLVLLMSASSWVSAANINPGEGGYTAADKEFYLTESQIAFIRPGLVLEIVDVVIPSDRQTEVTFKITDPAGLGLDREGIFTPGPVSTSFILSYLPEEGASYIDYSTRSVTSPITGDTAVQATTDSGGTYTVVDLLTGTYMYKFGTILPEDYDMDATHTLGIYARRDLLEFELDRYVENALESFIPSGNGVPVPRDIVTTETCNGRCHDPLAIHGGARQEVGLCVLCHNETQSTDPDTGESVYMPYMTHKIHAGADLANGYTIIGYRQSVHDYSEVEYPAILHDCEVCHTGGIPTGDFPLVADPNPPPTCDASGVSMTEMNWGDEGKVDVRMNTADGPLFASSGGAGSQATGKWVSDGLQFLLVDTDSGDVLQELPVYNSVFGCNTNPPGTFRGEPGTQHTSWMTNPTRMNCGSCHDDVNFMTGEGHSEGNIPQQNDDLCSTCHKADTGVEWDRSVAGAHTVEYKSNQLGGVLVEILDIQDTDPGDSPTVTFSLSDKFGPLSPAMLDRLRFSLSGPNTDFDFYVQETATNSLMPVGSNWSYTFAATLPADAMGSFTLGVEGRADAVLITGNDEEIETEDQMQNFTEGFAVTDTITMDRRMVVDDAKCENCHANLSLHGENRHDANTYCQTCHMPGATDAVVRPADAGPPEGIHFKYMIHKLHMGAELENGYVVYGYRSSVHDFGHVEYPGDLRNCESCHDGDTYTLPLPDGVLPTVSPATAINPLMAPMTSSCVSCHDSDSAASHSLANTSALGESCATCHGEGKTYGVERMHAR